MREGLKGAKRKKVKTKIILIRINKIKYHPEFERGFKKCKEKKVKSNIILIKIKILNPKLSVLGRREPSFLRRSRSR